MNRFLARALRMISVGIGSTFVVSAVVNVIATVKLIQPGDEEMFGLTRGEIIRTFAVFFVVGAAMIYLGLRRWQRIPPKL